MSPRIPPTMDEPDTNLPLEVRPPLAPQPPAYGVPVGLAAVFALDIDALHESVTARYPKILAALARGPE